MNPVEKNQTLAYAAMETPELFSTLQSQAEGLSGAEAALRFKRFGPNALKTHHSVSALRMFVRQLSSPLSLILIFAAGISALAGQWADMSIVMLIVLISAVLSFFQEYSASQALEKLRSQIRIQSEVIRDGKACRVNAEEIVPGDILLLSAGSLIPADGILLEANDFYVNQSALTGESFPVEKKPGRGEASGELADQKNIVFMGTNVRSGTARVLVSTTGLQTEFGKIAERLAITPEYSEFEKGIREFGYLLTRMIALLVLAVFIINILRHQPVMESLLFAIALAVGLAPELLPAILNINLAKGAQMMAKSGVIVRRLSAIENLGSMDILCTDKTGTLTEGAVHLDGALNFKGEPSEEVKKKAYINAAFQTGITNPLDEAILALEKPEISGVEKLKEIPYDFSRKRLSVIVNGPGGGDKALLITKGALESITGICRFYREEESLKDLDEAGLCGLREKFSLWSSQGYRVLGLATRDVPCKETYSAAQDEVEMIFEGFLLFFDPPKADVRQTLKDLLEIGVQVKVITGDNPLVAGQVAKAIGLSSGDILSFGKLKALSDEELQKVVLQTAIFAEVDPYQKERIITSLKKSGHVVGYMGDGINDAPALHAADIGISVDKAVDVAKEAADFVLLRQELSVLLEGIKEGRRTFANTLKYIFTTTSANFGNMLSMAASSLFLPFLPLLAKQILLNNFLSDIPALGMPGDSVDEEAILKPHRWNIRMIRNFMIVFGSISSLFDLATFGLLLWVARGTQAQFQTGWFIESLLTELLVALVIRTRKVFYKSRPGKLLLVSSLLVGLFTLTLPYGPISSLMGFIPLPLWLMGMLVFLSLLYVVVVEGVKRIFFGMFSW